MTSSLLDQALNVIPGGVNSPVRAFKNLGGQPIFMERAEGIHIYDIANQAYVDFCQSWGAMIMGHTQPNILQAVHTALDQGTSFGCATEKEIRLAEQLVDCVPSLEQVRCVSSGTEATMSALRLARGYTGRDLIVKFEGCYHGHADYLLVSAGSGLSEISTASSAGVPQAVVQDVICLPYNNSEAVQKLFQDKGNQVAAVIVEPVAANMGVILPQDGFLQILREVTDKYGSVLIFDEVISGFRLTLGGAQEYFGIIPDMTCLGKIIGGGFPVGAFGGRKDIMQHLAPCGNVYQAGTLSGNPIAMTAGLATLEQLQQPNFYTKLNSHANQAIQAMHEAINQNSLAITLQSIGSMFTLFFTEQPLLRTFEDVQACNHDTFADFYHHALKHRVYLSPSGYEANFITLLHTEDPIHSLCKAILSY